MSSRGRPDRPRKSRFAPDWHTIDTQDPTTNPADVAGNPWMSSINEPGPRITKLLRGASPSSSPLLIHPDGCRRLWTRLGCLATSDAALAARFSQGVRSYPGYGRGVPCASTASLRPAVLARAFRQVLHARHCHRRRSAESRGRQSGTSVADD